MQTRAVRRTDEIDAWIAAATKRELTLVDHDHDAFSDRPSLRYLNFRR